jgi:hypothetical protein
MAAEKLHVADYRPRSRPMPLFGFWRSTSWPGVSYWDTRGGRWQPWLLVLVILSGCISLGLLFRRATGVVAGGVCAPGRSGAVGAICCQPVAGADQALVAQLLAIFQSVQPALVELVGRGGADVRRQPQRGLSPPPLQSLQPLAVCVHPLIAPPSCPL